MIKTYIKAILFAGIIVTTNNVHATSLHEALAVAYKNNPTIKAERENLKAVDENLPQAFSGWLPNISADYSTSYERGKSTVAAGESRNYPHSRSLTISQSIFSGGQTYNSIKQAHNIIKSSRENLRQVEQRVFADAVSAYVDIVRSREVVSLSINNEKVLAEQLDATKDRFKLGEATITDVAQSESRLANAKSDRINAEGNLIAANSLYKRIYETDPPAEMSMPKMEGYPKDFDKALETALDHNPFLKAAAYNHKSSRNAIKVQFGGILPNASVNGSIRRTGGGGIGRLDSSETESLTLNIAVPLYQSGSQHSRIRQAKRNASRAKYNLRDAYNQTIDNVTQSWKDIKTSIANIEANTTSVKSAKLALDGVKEERDIGSRTTIEVLNAEQEYFTAQVSLITAKRNGIIAVYNLQASMGQLNAKKLVLDVPIYNPEEHFNDIKYRVFGF